jgi:hypothetical protein
MKGQHVITQAYSTLSVHTQSPVRMHNTHIREDMPTHETSALCFCFLLSKQCHTSIESYQVSKSMGVAISLPADQCLVLSFCGKITDSLLSLHHEKKNAKNSQKCLQYCVLFCGRVRYRSALRAYYKQLLMTLLEIIYEFTDRAVSPCMCTCLDMLARERFTCNIHMTCYTRM